VLEAENLEVKLGKGWLGNKYYIPQEIINFPISIANIAFSITLCSFSAFTDIIFLLIISLKIILLLY